MKPYFKTNLEKLAKKKNFNHHDIAARMNVLGNPVTAPAVANWFKGEPFSIKYVRTLCEVLECTPNDIFLITDASK